MLLHLSVSHSVHGGGMFGRGACVARGHAWQGGAMHDRVRACMTGSMHDRGHAWHRVHGRVGPCVAGAYMHGRGCA